MKPTISYKARTPRGTPKLSPRPSPRATPRASPRQSPERVPPVSYSQNRGYSKSQSYDRLGHGNQRSEYSRRNRSLDRNIRNTPRWVFI